MTTPPVPPAPILAPGPYKILVAVSLDATSDPALSQALSLAARTPGSELHAVHVAAESAPLTPRAELAAEDRVEQAKELLGERLESAWRQSGEIEVITHMRSGGDPSAVIIQTAVDIDADIVIVGSHRRTGLSKLVLGSVAERVLHGSPCPVLVAFPKDYGQPSAAPRLEPPCEECLAARKSSANAKFWCDRHTKRYLAPHVYVPRDSTRPSVRML